MNPLQSQSTPPTEPAERLAIWRSRFEDILTALLPGEQSQQGELHRAMRYAALDGGKRIRPVLAYAAGDALGLEPLAIDRLAASIEVIHAYSLIHDDLPAMDDDDMRRGRPSAHRAFDEATAILAGDALQALAFQIISEDGGLMPEIRLKIVTALARACGSMGMAGGQMLDLKAVGRRLRLPELEHMHALKTGALIELCVTAPGIIANADSQVLEALSTYGASIGLAFQVHDDVLDRIGETQSMGKRAMADAVKDKPTFPSTIGLEASRRRARELRDQAVAALDTCPGDRSTLIHLAHYVITRDR